MILERITVGPFAENCYLIGVPPRVAIVDPGAESERIAALIDGQAWRPEAILLTHGHLDHIAHVAHLAERYGIGCAIHREDLFLLKTPQLPEFAAMLGARPCPEPERILGDQPEVEVAGLTLDLLHTPGHSPGGVCFIDRASRSALVGDTLFRRGIGRTDLPGGDFETLERSVRDRLFTLDGELLLWPGHGAETRLDEERRENPFFGDRAAVVV